MATHGRRDLSKSNVQEASETGIARVIQTLAKCCCIHTGKGKAPRKNFEATWYVES